VSEAERNRVPLVTTTRAIVTTRREAESKDNAVARAPSPPKTRKGSAPAAAAKTLSGVAGFFWWRITCRQKICHGCVQVAGSIRHRACSWAKTRFDATDSPSLDIAGFLGCGAGSWYGLAGRKDEENQPHAPNRGGAFILLWPGDLFANHLTHPNMRQRTTEGCVHKSWRAWQG